MQVRGRERLSTQVSSWLQPGAWSPAQLPLTSWYDAADTSTITSSGSPAKVSQWSDKSGNSIHLTQSNESLRPLTNSETINGLNVISCDNHELGYSNWTITTRLVAVVIQGTSLASSNGSFWRHNDGSNQVILRHEGSGLNAIRYFSRTWNEDITLSGLSGLTSPHIIVAQTFDDRAISARLNGNTIGAKTILGSQPSITGNLYVCRFSWEVFRGNIAEIITSAQSLSAPQTLQLEKYLSRKWAIPINSGI